MKSCFSLQYTAVFLPPTPTRTTNNPPTYQILTCHCEWREEAFSAKFICVISLLFCSTFTALLTGSPVLSLERLVRSPRKDQLGDSEDLDYQFALLDNVSRSRIVTMGPLHVTFTLLASVLLVAFLTGCSGTLIDTPEHLQIPVIIGSGEIVTTFDKKKVRGNAPVYYCSDPKTDLFEIEAIDIVPFPPV